MVVCVGARMLPNSLLSDYLSISLNNKLCHTWEMQIAVVATEPKSCDSLVLSHQYHSKKVLES